MRASRVSQPGLARIRLTTFATRLAMLLIAAAGIAHAAPGDIDPTFAYAQPADPQRDSANVIEMPDGGWIVIRNRAPFAQEHPALELTLTDAADMPVVRRVLQPSEYLDAAGRAALAQGIAAGGESVLRVYFDARGLRATGYRVYLFYPPA